MQSAFNGINIQTPVRYGCAVVLLVLIMFLMSAPSLRAEERPMKIAVNTFSSVNCPPSDPMALEELVSQRIYRIPFMTLLERQQMEIIFRKNNLLENGTFDIAYATKLGKVLSVDKMILGSVRKDTSYEITVKVIDVANSTVDTIISRKTADSAGFSKAADEIASEIESFYRSGRKRPFSFFLHASADYLCATGELADELYGGFGSTLGVSGMVSDNESLQLSFGLRRFVSRKGYISSFNMLTVCLQGQYHARITGNLTLIPSPGCGYTIGQKVYDKIRVRNSGNREFTTAYFYNPTVVFNAELRWRMLDKTAFSFFILNQVIGEKTHLDYLPGLALGMNLSF